MAVAGRDHLTALVAERCSAEEPKLRATFTGHTDAVWSVVFSPDSKILASGGKDKSILLWDVSSGKVLATKPAPHRVGSVAFSPDSKLIAAASGDKTVRLWEAR